MRSKHNNVGRPRKYNKVPLGGIPMKCVNGKISYTQYVPMKYWYNHISGTYEDKESIERKKAQLPIGLGSFQRKHIYEMRFDLDE
jgi:hypothetical protein